MLHTIIEWFKNLDDTNKIAIVVPVGLAAIGGLFALIKCLLRKKNDSPAQQKTIQQEGMGNTATMIEDKTAIIGDNVGRDKITPSGDYVAGDKIIKSGPSKEEIKIAMKEVLQEHEPNLRMKYGENYSVAAITRDGFVVPKGEVPSGINVKWETGRVLNVSSERVQIALPEITGKTVHIKEIHISGNTIDIPKKIGSKLTLIRTKDFVVEIKVIGIDQDLVVVGIGMAPS
jgi:hypothetical protein